MKEKVKKALFFKISFLIFFCITEAFTALLFSFQANAQVGRARISPATPAVPDPAPELCELNGEQFYLQRNGLFRLNVNGSALSFSQIFSFPDHLKDNQREIYFFRNSDNSCLTFQGKMFFVLSKADSASIVTASIWQSDGTASGTFEVSSLAFPNKTPSEIIDAAVFNNSLYYLAKEKDTNNIYLLKWTNLSQPAQTLKAWVVPDDDPEFLPDASHLFAFNNYIAFRACDSINGCELWRTNGTPNGTETINEEGDPFDDGIGNSLIKIGDKLLFVDARPTSSTFGSLLALNTLTDSVDPLATGEITALHVNSSTDIDLPMRRHNNLVFAAAGITDIDSLFETTLWATDGTTEGTTRIKDFFYLDITSIGMPSLGNLFFFKGLDVQSNDSDISFFMQTFKTDGTVSNTSPVLLPTDNPYTNSIADFFYNFNGKIIFLGETESTTALWQTTGSLPSQIFNTQNSLLSYPDYLNFAEFAKAINNNLYLTVNESLALKINSSLNKLTLSDFLPPNPQVHYSSKTEILSTTPHIMVYSAYDFNSEKKELYYTKGKAGALKLNNLFPAGTEVGKVFSTTEDKQGNFFFFIQPRDSFSCSLWKSRTDAGTAEQIVTFPLVNGYICLPTRLNSVFKEALFSNGRLYFVMLSLLDETFSLWTSDLTPSGTQPLLVNKDFVGILGEADGFIYIVSKNSESTNILRLPSGTQSIEFLFSANHDLDEEKSFLLKDGVLLFLDIDGVVKYISADSSNLRVITDAVLGEEMQTSKLLLSKINGKYILYSYIPTELGDSITLYDLNLNTASAVPIKEVQSSVLCSLSHKPFVYDLPNVAIFNLCRELFRTDGTFSGTFLLTDSFDDFNRLLPPLGQVYNGRLYSIGFEPGDSARRGIVVTDGTFGGTKLFSEAPSLSSSRSKGALYLVNNSLVFLTKNDDLVSIDLGSVCPPGSLKEVAGVCGCNVPDVDLNNNGVIDCIENDLGDLGNVVPEKPKLHLDGRDIIVEMRQLPNVRYTVLYSIKKKGKGKKKSTKKKRKKKKRKKGTKTRSITSDSPIVVIKKAPLNSIVKVSYFYTSLNPSAQTSKESPKAKIKVKKKKKKKKKKKHRKKRKKKRKR